MHSRDLEELVTRRRASVTTFSNGTGFMCLIINKDNSENYRE